MNTCSTCRYWDPQDDSHEDRVCVIISEYDRWVDPPAGWPVTELAWTTGERTDGPGSLVTAPTFGCNLWEPPE